MKAFIKKFFAFNLCTFKIAVTPLAVIFSNFFSNNFSRFSFGRYSKFVLSQVSMMDSLPARVPHILSCPPSTNNAFIIIISSSSLQSPSLI